VLRCSLARRYPHRTGLYGERHAAGRDLAVPAANGPGRQGACSQDRPVMTSACAAGTAFGFGAGSPERGWASGP